MKIGQTSGTPQWDAQVRPDSGRASVAPSAGGDESKASLSALSSQLQALETKLSQTGGTFDAARIEALKEAIRTGQFKVDTDIVADRLLASVRELIGR